MFTAFFSKEIIALLVIFLIALYLKLKHGHRYWKRRNVPYIEPNLIFGNIFDFFFRSKPLIDFYQDLYKKSEGKNYIGFYAYQKPELLIRNPNIIKLILQKDFSYFENRGLDLYNEAEPISDHLFNMEGERWRNLRKKLTPAFTTGKIKSMLVFIKECCDHMNTVLKKSAKEGDSVEAKDLMARYNTDVISSCAFGVDTNSLSTPDSKFRQMGARIFKIRLEHLIRLFLKDTCFSFLIKLCGLRFFEKEVTDFFTNSIHQMVEYRESKNIVRGDFLDLLIGIKKDEKTISELQGLQNDTVEISIQMIAAQCFLFFAAGFETSSSTLSFCLFELARNPDVQRKLQEEIDETIKENDRELTYDLLQSMPYLEKVISETLRMYPPLYVLTRKCTKNYKMPDTETVIEKGTEIVVPVFAIHHDTQYYKNPEMFDPENFNEDRKTTRPQFTYLPFGEGPRICIGMRFGQMQVKAGIISILQNYHVQLSSKCKLPLKFEHASFVTNTTGGIWLKFSKRHYDKF